MWPHSKVDKKEAARQAKSAAEVELATGVLDEVNRFCTDIVDEDAMPKMKPNSHSGLLTKLKNRLKPGNTILYDTEPDVREALVAAQQQLTDMTPVAMSLFAKKCEDPSYSPEFMLTALEACTAVEVKPFMSMSAKRVLGFVPKGEGMGSWGGWDGIISP